MDACRRASLSAGGWGAAVFAAADRGECSEAEAERLVRSFLSAGVDTTVNGIGNLIGAFLAFSTEWDRLRADPAAAKKAFEESLRWDATVQTFFRTTARPVEVAGVRLPEGAKVLLFLASANRDPRRWSDPERFDIGRNASGHVAFGFGIHQCLGQMVARMEAEVLLEAMIPRIRRVRAAGAAGAPAQQYASRTGVPSRRGRTRMSDGIASLGPVLIVGGGIGGMATAIALLKQRRDLTIDIIDIDPEWKVYGAGITITGPTLRAFRDLGLLDAIAEQGFLSIGAHMHLFDGTLLSANEELPIEPGLPSAGGIMRPRLHQIMADEVRRLGATVRLGITVDALDQDERGVAVTFSDGSAGRYDLVVGADGIYSKVRGMLFPDAVQPAYTGQMSWRVVSPRPPEMDVSHFYFGHENIAGTVPCSQTEVYSFVLNPEPNPRRVPEADKPAFLRGLLSDFGGDMARIREGITDQSAIVQRPFEYALQPLPWHRGRVVLIGDAVHATTAHLASGAGISVEDGLVLAQELVRAEGDVPAAIAAFEQRRFDRCKLVVESSVGICRAQLQHAPPQEIGARMGRAMHALAEAI